MFIRSREMFLKLREIKKIYIELFSVKIKDSMDLAKFTLNKSVPPFLVSSGSSGSISAV